MDIEKLTNSFTQLIENSYKFQIKNNNANLTEYHLLKTSINEKDFIYDTLIHSGVNTIEMINSLNERIKNIPVETSNKSEEGIHISKSLSQIFQLCEKISTDLGDKYISLDALLLAYLDSSSDIKDIITNNNKIKKSTIENNIKKGRKGNTVNEKNTESTREALKKFTINLTEKAKAGKLDPVIGRDDEIRRAIQILQRRTKNNPVLIGEPGVGKTAIVEGIAQRIVNNEVPESLKNKNLLVLDLPSLLAGAKFRGDFEERLKSILNELAEDFNNNLIFIDEIHTLVGAGKTEGSMDAGNMLKPALARGELHCIGATTLDEYRKYVEKDPALERRFQKVLINEPTVEDTIAILRGLQEKYESHHGVEITDPAIVAAAELSHRYITDRFLPDKAIDLIDEAAAKIKIEIDSKPEVMDKLNRKIIQLKIEKMAVEKETDSLSIERCENISSELKKLEKEYLDFEEILNKEKNNLSKITSIKDEIADLKLQIENLKRAGHWDKVAEIEYGKLPEKMNQLNTYEHEVAKNSNKNKLLKIEVGAEEIAEIVSKATGIPVSKMQDGEKHKLLKIEELLKQRVIGQDDAIKSVSSAIKRSRAGLSDINKPYGSFMFLGSTGTGKTELCKSLANFLFDNEDHLIRIDMSEYMEKHSVARLIGAPPGYVGYEEGGYLTEQVRRKPYSVILFDEVEKAHPDVFNIFLQVLDDGRLTDSQGRTVDFSNTVIVMTSNIGSKEIQNMEKEPYENIKKVVMDELKDFFRPEFLNRIDDVVVFHSLNKNNIISIVKIQINKLIEKLGKNHINLHINSNVINYIVEKGYDPVYGARPLKRAIQQYLENPLADFILKGEGGKKININIENDKIMIK